MGYPKSTCSVIGCNRAARARGWCNLHGNYAIFV